jgi:hypothetical protein
MGVPYPGRVYAFPGGLHQFVPRQRFRQAAAAGIEETLIGPVTPCGKATRAQDCTGAGGEKFSAADGYVGESLI